jgi:hypothetical protein
MAPGTHGAAPAYVAFIFYNQAKEKGIALSVPVAAIHFIT